MLRSYKKLEKCQKIEVGSRLDRVRVKYVLAQTTPDKTE